MEVTKQARTGGSLFLDAKANGFLLRSRNLFISHPKGCEVTDSGEKVGTEKIWWVYQVFSSKLDLICGGDGGLAAWCVI